MNLEEFYQSIHGDYAEVTKRLFIEGRLIVYLKAFVEDNTVMKIKTHLIKKDYKTAFIYAHSLKGECLSLSLGDFKEKAIIFSDKLKNQDYENIDDMFIDLEKDFKELSKLIKKIR